MIRWIKAHLNWTWGTTCLLLYATIWWSTPIPYLVWLVVVWIVTLWVLAQKGRSYWWAIIPISVLFLDNKSLKGYEQNGTEPEYAEGGEQMELSPEEKRKIYEEEKARLEAAVEPRQIELSAEEKRKIYEEEKARLEVGEEPRESQLPSAEEKNAPEERPLTIHATYKSKKRDWRYDLRGMLVLVVILLIGAISWGAVAQTRLSNSEANLSTTKANLATAQEDLSKSQADLASTQAGLASTQADLATTQAELADTKTTLSSAQTNLSQVQTQLTAMQAKFPPHEFASSSDLQNWASAHVQSYTIYVHDTYLECLTVQNLAAQDGYIVGITTSVSGNTFFVANSATVNGTLYYWDPGVATVYSENSYQGVNYFQR